MEERSDPGDAGGNASSLSSGESGTNADIEQIAPLTSLKPAKTDKLKSANVTLRWTVKILAPAKPAENAGETPKKEGKQ